MKNVGIIAEYNPLHSGHIYHMTSSLPEEHNVIVAMSGNFTERGDVAVANKYNRAKFAVENGADLVVEIPTAAVLSCAEHFAKAGVKVLTMLGGVDFLSFGSECGELETLKTVANSITDIDIDVKKYLSEGLPYPSAFSKAYVEKISTGKVQDAVSTENTSRYDNELADITAETLKELLQKPNNILGIEYIRALKDSNIEPITLKRIGQGYNSEEISSAKYTSAQAIRNSLYTKDVEAYLQKDILEHIRSVDIDNDLIVKLLKYDLLVHNKDISEINNVSEGIDNRIRDTLSLCKSGYGEFLSSVKTKRYTMARIKRILLSILLDIKKSVLHSIDSLDYITVLAVKRDRLHLLKDAKVKLVTKYKDYAATSHVFKEIDLKANSLYNVVSSDSIDSHSMIIID